jgi:hypothetical protein
MKVKFIGFSSFLLLFFSFLACVAKRLLTFQPFYEEGFGFIKDGADGLLVA